MTEIAAETAYKRDHKCQTPDCPNDFAVIQIDVDDSEVTMLCKACQMAFWVAVLQQITQEMVATQDGEPAPGVAAVQQP